jgi:toxin YoeB
VERLIRLIDDTRRSPCAGLGKPEALRGDLAGCWSRRITTEHRLIYRIAGRQGIEIAACRYHSAHEPCCVRATWNTE